MITDTKISAPVRPFKNFLKEIVWADKFPVDIVTGIVYDAVPNLIRQNRKRSRQDALVDASFVKNHDDGDAIIRQMGPTVSMFVTFRGAEAQLLRGLSNHPGHKFTCSNSSAF